LVLAIAWRGEGFRFTDATYANLRDLATGEGSLKAGGRWNPKGAFPTLYLSLTPETALAEVLAHQRIQGIPDVMATPMTLAGFRVDVQGLLDLTDTAIRRLLRVTLPQLKQPWWPIQHAGREALTQAIGRLAYETGFRGLLVPSAPDRAGRNLALFPDRLVRGELEIVHEVRYPKFRRRTRRK
jgi:RES domain-containing protein